MPSYDRMPTGRTIDQVLEFHGLSPEALEGALIYDLGCGQSDLERDLALRGVKSSVLGFDIHPVALRQPTLGSRTTRIAAPVAEIPVPDGSGDFVFATYSHPMMAETVEEIETFYNEATRITSPGGILGIYPIYNSIIRGNPESRKQRAAATQEGAREIIQSSAWLDIGVNREAVTVRRIA